jgi:hypothetical protein
MPHSPDWGLNERMQSRLAQMEDRKLGFRLR